MGEITDAERVKIQKEAQDLLKKFSATLMNVKISKKLREEEVGGWREEGDSMMKDDDFRERMFSNAHMKDENCIIAEKKKW